MVEIIFSANVISTLSREVMNKLIDPEITKEDEDGNTISLQVG